MPTRLAPAKLNLGLHVLRRRADGYHDLDTVFVPIGWHDVVTAQSADTLTLTCSDARLPTDASNLVVRAAEALQKETGVEAGAALHLDKHVPYGAGLGGGSSDAAATLRLLVELWGLDVPKARLHALAAALGADVPFFLDAAAARGAGIGDVLTPLRAPGGEAFALPYPLVVAVPDVHVSTAEAYRLVSPNDTARPDLGALVESLDLDRWRVELVNDFEAPLVAAHPALEALRDALRDGGAAYVSMSGSGSAFFGVFEEPAKAQATTEALRYEGFAVWSGMAGAV